MNRQLQVQCIKCNTILNFSADHNIERIIKCSGCDNIIKVRFCFEKLEGKKFERIYVDNAKFIPESQRKKYNY